MGHEWMITPIGAKKNFIFVKWWKKYENDSNRILNKFDFVKKVQYKFSPKNDD